MNGVYSEFAEEGLNSKKYIVYEKLNKIGGGKTFNNAKDACKYARYIDTITIKVKVYTLIQSPPFQQKLTLLQRHLPKFLRCP